MKLVTTLCVAFIYVRLIINCTAQDNFDNILNDYYSEVTLSQTEIDSLKNLPSNSWKSMVKIFKERAKKHDDVVKDLKNEKLKSPAREFACAVASSKNIIQWFNKDGLKIMDLEESAEYGSAPQFYLNLIVQQQEHDSKYTKVVYFVKLCKQWYHFITKSENAYATRLQTNLQLYFDQNPNKYADIGELKRTFCASVARSNRLFNYLSYTLLPLMDVAAFGTEQNRFTKFLFDKMPFYYLGSDDLDFINILLLTRLSVDGECKEGSNNEYILKYALVNNPNLKAGLMIKAPSNQCNNVENKEVLIPLSDACLLESFKATSVKQPFTTPSSTKNNVQT